MLLAFGGLVGLAESPAHAIAEPLRELAARVQLEIGYAARINFLSQPDIDRYREITQREFSIVTPEHALKWSVLRPLPGEFDFDEMDTLIDYARAADMQLHAHPLLWHHELPGWVQVLSDSDLETAIIRHIDSVVRRYRNTVAIYDVVNEPIAEDGSGLRSTAFSKALGPRYIDVAFKTARAADPGATLLINEYDIGWLNAKSDELYRRVQGWLADGLSVDGIGMQMHIDQAFNHAEGLSSNMQRFADLGLELYITEFDVGVPDASHFSRQAEIYRLVLERCLMQPACRGLQIWGLDDLTSWRAYEYPLPFDSAMQPKPAYFALRQALASEPVHIEHCEIGVASSLAGAVRGAGRIVCRDVRLSGGYRTVRLRYRNIGVETPELLLKANRRMLARAELPPTAESAAADGYPNDATGALSGSRGYQTLSIAIEPLQSTADVELTLQGKASRVDLDALLFVDPAGSVMVDRDDPDYQLPLPAPPTGTAVGHADSTDSAAAGIVTETTSGEVPSDTVHVGSGGGTETDGALQNTSADDDALPSDGEIADARSTGGGGAVALAFLCLPLAMLARVALTRTRQASGKSAAAPATTFAAR